MRIRTQQISVPGTGGEIIVGDGSGGGVVVTPGGANQVPLFDGTSTGFGWLDTLYSGGTGVFAGSVSGAGTGNYLVAVRDAAGNPAVLQLSGTDATNADILIQPGSGGRLLLPTGYEANVDDQSVPNAVYVKNTVYGNDWKASVRAATVGAGDLAGMTYNAAGDNWTTGVTVTFDGVGLANGDRVLIKDAADQRGNGIWVWNSTAQTMTRPEDADSSNDISGGMAVYVAEGSSNAQAVFVLTSPTGAATPGTSNLVFTKLVDTGAGNLTAGTGIDITGSTISIDWTNVTTTTSVADTNQLVVYDGSSHLAIQRGDFLGRANITLKNPNYLVVETVTAPHPSLSSPADGQFDIGFGTGDTRLRFVRTTGTDASVRLLVTDGLLVPVGTTAQRPTSASAGVTRYNSTDNKLEYYNGSAWVQLAQANYGYNETTITAGANPGGDFTITNFFSYTPLGAPTNKAHVHVYINGVGLRNAEWDYGGATNQNLVIHQGTLGYDLAANDVVWARYVY